MDKKELMEKYEKNLVYLKRTIPPDDIYDFSEQTFMAALFFLKQWSELEDLEEVMKKDPIAMKWIINILSFQRCKDEEIDINLDLNLDPEDEECD